MGNSLAVPYYSRLRVLSREAGFFYYRLNKLDPVYDDCPNICRSPYADKANGCPDCEYTNAFKFFRQQYQRELKEDIQRRIRESVTGDTLLPSEEAIKARVEQEASAQPDFETLYRDYCDIISLEDEVGIETAESEGGYNPLWLIRTAHAIAIVRSERRKVRRIIRQREERERESSQDSTGNKVYSRYG